MTNEEFGITEEINTVAYLLAEKNSLQDDYYHYMEAEKRIINKYLWAARLQLQSFESNNCQNIDMLDEAIVTLTKIQKYYRGD